MFLCVVISELLFGPGPRPIRVLACPTSPGLVLPSIHSYLWLSVQSGVEPQLSGVMISDTGAICGLGRL